MTMDSRPRVGVLGAGQLALMLAQAGAVLGVNVICAGQPGDCAEQVAPVAVVDLNDKAQVAAFGATVDCVTVESENIDAAVLQGLKLFPNANAVATAQDRLVEKRFFQACGIEVAPYAAVDSAENMDAAMDATGVPAILKTRRMGYDGKGQARLRGRDDAMAAWNEVGPAACILEGMVQFEAEVSLIAGRNVQGQIAFYPLVENRHRAGILRRSNAPYVHGDLQQQAEAHMRSVLERLEYVGVLAIEFFVVDGHLLANEMAPRVHNSGHWTIEGAETSQFAMHLQAGLGMELGSTKSSPTVMLNCIGAMPAVEETAMFPAVLRHDYGKEPRRDRKVGHLTIPAGETAAIGAWEQRLNEAD